MADVQLSSLGSTIKTAYQAEANAFTDTKNTKLSGIEDNATADQTGAEIKTAYEAEANAYTDTKDTKLSGIEAGATADQTGAEIKTAYEAEANAYTDTKDTKLGGIEAGATADQTGAEIKTAYEAEANAYTDTKDTLLADISIGYSGQNLQTGTTYTLVLGDAGKMIEMNNASANTVNIPANASVAFPVDTRIDVIQYGAGLTTVTITTDTLTGAVVSTGRYKAMSLWKRSATEWVVIGGTTA